eukprot:11119079-Alexandrium_andersonii.AAC.1
MTIGASSSVAVARREQELPCGVHPASSLVIPRVVCGFGERCPPPPRPPTAIRCNRRWAIARAMASMG